MLLWVSVFQIKDDAVRSQAWAHTRHRCSSTRHIVDFTKPDTAHVLSCTCNDGYLRVHADYCLLFFVGVCYAT